jgi:carbamoyltransferase
MFLATETTHRMLVRYEPDVGHLYVPNQCARVPSPEGGFYVRTNALGFRSDRPYVTARGERPRILFFGDSFTAGDGVDNGDRFSERVADALGGEAYNFGLSGSGTDQQLLLLEKYGKGMAADLIVLALQVENIDRIQVGNRPAIDRITRRRMQVPKPYFTLQPDGSLALHHVPVPRDRPPEVPGNDATETRHGLVGSAIEFYRTAKGLEDVRRMTRKHLELSRSLALRVSGFDPYPDYAHPHSAGFALLRAIVRRFQAAANGVPVLVVPLPNYYYLLHGLEPKFQRRIETLAQDGLTIGDLVTPLMALSREQRRKLLLSDGHFSVFGHGVVAQHMADAIRGRGLLPVPAAKPAVHVKKATTGKWVLGVSALYHNSAAALVHDGRIVAAAEEERFTRVKNDRRLPQQAINFCLEQAGLRPSDLSAVVYYDNAYLTFERLLHTLAASGERSADAWQRILPSWLRFKLRVPHLLRRQLGYEGPILQEEHHRSHAAAAFLPAPFERAAILTVDGVGEWATAAIGRGDGSRVELLREMHFPHSLGLLYSAFTHFTGFKVNSGEYKMMGLAPYGEPRYVQAIYDHLVQVHDDGSLRLNLDHFAFLTEPTMTNERFAALFGGPARKPDAWISQRERDLARSVQVVTEEVLLKMARHAHALTGEKKLCLSGGVALNCVANGRILREGPFDDIWIQPAAGDAGSALGAALDVCHNWFGVERRQNPHARPPQGGSCLGPQFSDDEIRAFLDTYGYPYEVLDESQRGDTVAGLLDEGKVVGHFAGRLEFGPRALGSRSILGDPRNADTQAVLNLKIKYRESFRPFAPVVLAEKTHEYFELDRESPYMLLVAPVRSERRQPLGDVAGDDLTSIVRQVRSDLPAITHIDYSARIQSIVRADHPQYHDVVAAFARRTGCAVLVNTSFNVRGEPIVATPFDAYRCFMRTEMDVLVLGNLLLHKATQPPWPEEKGHVEKSEDAADAAPVPEDDARLRALFASQFLPALPRMQGDVRCRLKGAAGASNWVDHAGPSQLHEILEIPSALQDPDGEPRAQAEAMIRQWRPGPGTDALRPVVVALLEIAHRKPAEEADDERVSDSAYVMF